MTGPKYTFDISNTKWVIQIFNTANLTITPVIIIKDTHREITASK